MRIFCHDLNLQNKPLNLSLKFIDISEVFLPNLIHSKLMNVFKIKSNDFQLDNLCKIQATANLLHYGDGTFLARICNLSCSYSQVTFS